MGQSVYLYKFWDPYLPKLQFGKYECGVNCLVKGRINDRAQRIHNSQMFALIKCLAIKSWLYWPKYVAEIQSK